MAHDHDRRELHEALQGSLGPGPGGRLMSMLDQMATQHDIDMLRAELHAEMAALRADMADLRTDLAGQMADLRTELKTEMAELRTELKGDIGDLRVGMSGMLPKLIAANIASMVGIAGLIVASAAIL